MGLRDWAGRIRADRRLSAVARKAFGWRELRPGQREAMQYLLGGHDVLVVMPTGSGKSAVYQVPALLLDGPTVVVSPLIALQRDQVAGLAETGAPGAVAVNSAQQGNEASLERVRAGDAEFVFLSPEQLAKPEVIDRLRAARPSLIAIDEAHCVSAWGHDFRPDYLRLGKAIERLGHPPVAALTATAAPLVRDDIVRVLGLSEAKVVVRGFDRPNISLEVRRFAGPTSKEDKRRALVQDAAARTGLGLVYVATRRAAEEYAGALREEGRRAEAYHAGMKATERHRVHELFRDGGLDVVVATSAFGMGIDKPDVRYVLHADPPESPDSYYQEIGRAGRDGKAAEAVLFYRPEDLGVRRFFAGGRADEELLVRVATLVREHGGTVPARELRELLDIGSSRLTSVVNLLERVGAVTVTEGGDLRPLPSGPEPERAAAEAVELDDTRRRVDESRIDMMRGYAETTGCRRRTLLEYFGEPYERACGNCDTCRAAGATGTAADGREEGPAADGPFPMHAKVVHKEWGQGVVMSRDPDRVTVMFEEVGYKTLSLQAVERDGLLVLAP
ncbi:RecQ family ATP-dependent DNA helicase [Sphaerisporangium album]|uniref:ATP-dependent DNA helicase RecQ n=1 Tax=Sphaerisporangium album TaxID=509200 RepID=A0A367FMJ6_9ACTN|nr:RecQ family ATP-dependent DNA helicase [Sphaerisporangium album]RCG30947.1 RecQ family ATP-dependent DNA helicase [Sphaerisporangium album]